MSGMNGIGAMMGIIPEMMGNNMNMQNQKDMMRFAQNQQAGADYRMFDLNKRMWDATNYEAQMEHIKKAGLSAGLLYKGGGGGGAVTTNSGTAPTPTAPTMDISKGMQTGMQIETAAANVDLMKSQAELNRVEAAKKAGVDTDESRSRIPTYGKQIEKTDSEIKEIASKIGVNEESVRNMIANENKANAETKRINTLTPLDAQKTKAETVSAGVQQQLMKSNIKVNDQQIEKMSTDMLQGWENLRIQEQNRRINEFKAELEAEYPALSKTMGKGVNEVFKWIHELLEEDTKANKVNKKEW